MSSPTRTPELLVRLLGPIDVAGAADSLTAQHTAVLAFVGTHTGADIATLREALWRDNQPTQRRSYNVLSELRGIVGIKAFPNSARRPPPTSTSSKPASSPPERSHSGGPCEPSPAPSTS